jgi:hypothetical protein
MSEKPVPIKFLDEVVVVDKLLDAAYSRGAKELMEDIVMQAKKVASENGMHFLDVQLGLLVLDALQSVKKETKQ